MNGRRNLIIGIAMVVIGLMAGLNVSTGPRVFHNAFHNVVATPADALVRVLLAPVRLISRGMHTPMAFHGPAPALRFVTSNRNDFDLVVPRLGQTSPTAPRTQPIRPPAPGWIETSPYIFRRPIFRLGQDYTVRKDDEVREVVAISGNVTVEGRVTRDIIVVVGDVRLESTADIYGSLVVTAGSVTIAQGAVIHDDLIVVGGTVDAPPGFSPNGQHVAIGATPLGDTLRSIVPWIMSGLLLGRLIVPSLGWVWAVVGVFFLVYAGTNVIFDKPVRACAKVMHDRPIAAMFAGMIMLILLGPIFLIMAATVVGIAVIPFFACAVLVAWMLGKVGVIRALGARVLPPGEPETHGEGLRSFVIGFVAITLTYMVPVLGMVVWAMVGVFGLGAATLTFSAALRREPKPRPAGPAPAAPPLSAPPEAPPSGPGASGPPDPTWSPSYGGPSGATAAPDLAFRGSVDPPVGPAPAFTENRGAAAPAPAAPARAASAVPYATFLDRVAAFVLDFVLVAIANGFIGFARAGGPLLLWVLLYHIAFWAWMSTSMGGIVVGIRVMRTDGTPLRPVDAVVRGLAGIFSLAAFGIGCFWMLQDAERQMWHDKIAGTYVVKVPKNLLLA